MTCVQEFFVLFLQSKPEIVVKIKNLKKKSYTSTRTAKVKKDTKYYNPVQQPNAHIHSGGNASWHNH